MITNVLVGVLALLTYVAINQTERSLTPLSGKVTVRLQKLWLIAQHGMKEQKYLRAEKALLTILKLDQTNAAAYNRLGILYSRQKEYKDAIECFEIASSIQPSASSLHNLGLIYFETEHFEKAAHAFESALKLEDGLPARYIAYAKVQEKLGNTKLVIDALIKANDIEPTAQSLKMLGEAYLSIGDKDEARKIKAKMDRINAKPDKPKRVKRHKKVVF